MKDQPKHTPGPWFIDVATDENERIELFVRRDGDAISIAGDITDPETGLPGKDNARLIAAAPDLLESLKALTTNPHVNLGDLVYKVRDSEGEGWDGPQVKAWSDAVQAAAAAIAKAEGREG